MPKIISFVFVEQSEPNESPSFRRAINQRGSIRITPTTMALSSPMWNPTPEWVAAWRLKLPLQTIMRLLQVLVPQVEKICIDKYVQILQMKT